MRHKHAHNFDEHGIGVSRGRLMDHTFMPNLVMRGCGLDYQSMDDEGRHVYFPVCLKYRAGDGRGVINVSGCIYGTRKLIAWHMMTYNRHKQALEEEQRKTTRGLHRH